MKTATIAVICALGASQVACGANGANIKDLTALIKTSQDDKACDRIRDIDIGANAGQLGGEVHNTFKEHSECGVGHGAQGIRAGQMVAPTTAPAPSIPTH